MYVHPFLFTRFHPALPASSPLAARLAMAFESLGARLIFLCGQAFPGLQPLFQLLQRRCVTVFRRLDALMVLWGEGRLPPPRADSIPAARGSRVGPSRALQAEMMRLMRARGHRTGPAWLVRFMPPMSLATCQFENWLEEARARQFLDECPQAARLLRPILRMLGVRHAWLDAGQAARAPAVAAEAAPVLPPAPRSSEDSGPYRRQGDLWRRDVVPPQIE